jgi:hypothetical protein
VGFKIVPFTRICRGDCVTNIAAKRLPTGIVRRTFLSTIEFCNRRIKPIINGSNILRFKIKCGFVDFALGFRHNQPLNQNSMAIMRPRLETRRHFQINQILHSRRFTLRKSLIKNLLPKLLFPNHQEAVERHRIRFHQCL